MDKKELLADTFKWLFLGLLCCFAISYVTSINETIFNMVYLSFGGYGYLIFAGIELVLCIVLSFSLIDMKPTLAKVLYLLYTGLTGLTLTGIFMVYTKSSITFVFFATALIFGVFAFIGKTTKLDLSKFGIYLLVALIAIIILEVINLFLLNNTLNIILCIVTIIVFAGYVAFDINRLLKEDYLYDNKGIYYAFQLFIDFINIFIKLLRLFGKRND